MNTKSESKARRAKLKKAPKNDSLISLVWVALCDDSLAWVALCMASLILGFFGFLFAFWVGKML